MTPSDEALLTEARTHLAADETLLWHGRPIAEACLRPTIPLLLLATAAAFVLSMMAATGTHDPRTTAWEPFLMLWPAACIVVLAVQAVKWADARRTLFAITDRQILVIRTGWRAKRTSLSRPNDWRLELSPYRLGFGTIQMLSAPYSYPPDNEPQYDRIRLGVIADPNRPFALLRQRPACTP